MRFPFVVACVLSVAVVPSVAQAGESVRVCGADRSATMLDQDGAVPKALRTGLVAQCVRGRWVKVRSGRTSTRDHADLRVRSGGRTNFVRVGEGGVVEVPISFVVRNVNRTPVPGGADGREYTIRGHISAPAAALADGVPKSATLFAHGHSFSEELWRYRAAGGSYDFAAAMARDGHTAVTFDRLGYEASGKPNGFESSYASEADVFSQLVDHLKAGTYTASGRAAPSFDKVALAGHSQAAIISELTASTFENIDGLIDLSFVSDFASVPLVVNYAANVADCFTAPSTANQEAGNPTGYAFRGKTEADFRATNFFNTDPAVVADVTPRRNVDPCGLPVDVVPTFGLNNILNSKTKVPVLIALGANDPNFMVPELALKGGRDQFTMANDKEFVLLEDTGHAMMLERTAPRLQRIVADWLNGHGF